MAFKNPIQLANNIEDDNIYNEWKDSILTEARRNSTPQPMATSLEQAPLKKINPDEFRKMGFDKELSDKVINHIQRYEGVSDRFANDIGNASQGLNGLMIGLEYRQKRPESLARKLQYAIDEKRKVGDMNYNYDDALKEIKDTARFTLAYGPENFSENVYETINRLRKNGYNIIKFKNYFGEEGPYRGLNTVFQDANGNMFELQFHMPSSMKAKEGIDVDLLNRAIHLNKAHLNSHDIYETTRVLENKMQRGVITPQEKRLYDILMKKAVEHWQGVPILDLKYEF